MSGASGIRRGYPAAPLACMVQKMVAAPTNNSDALYTLAVAVVH